MLFLWLLLFAILNVSGSTNITGGHEKLKLPCDFVFTEFFPMGTARIHFSLNFSTKIVSIICFKFPLRINLTDLVQHCFIRKCSVNFNYSALFKCGKAKKHKKRFNKSSVDAPSLLCSLMTSYSAVINALFNQVELFGRTGTYVFTSFDTYDPSLFFYFSIFYTCMSIFPLIFGIRYIIGQVILVVRSYSRFYLSRESEIHFFVRFNDDNLQHINLTTSSTKPATIQSLKSQLRLRFPFLKFVSYYLVFQSRVLKDTDIIDSSFLYKTIEIRYRLKGGMDEKPKVITRSKVRTEVQVDSEKDVGGDRAREYVVEVSEEGGDDPLAISDLEERLQVLLEQQRRQEKEIERLRKELSAKEESVVKPVTHVGLVFSPFKPKSSSTTSLTPPTTSTTSSTHASIATDESRKGAKPLKLTGIPLYEGKSSFKKWLRMFELKIISGNHSESVKYVTLLEYLSPEIFRQLSALDRSIFSSYPLLINFLQQEYKSFDPVGGTVSMNMVLQMKQGEDESVSSFASRLATAIEDCEEMNLNGSPFEKNCFLDGLKEKLQVEVRKYSHEDIDSLLTRAKVMEDNLIMTNAALNRHGVNNNNSNNNSNNNIGKVGKNKTPNSSSICLDCSVLLSSSKHKYCLSCFNKRRESKESKESKKEVKKVCSKCNLRPPNFGFAWCEQCYQEKQKSLSSSSPLSPSPSPFSSINWSKTRVQFLETNDDSKEPLLWTDKKLQSQKRCFYCAIPLSSHSPPSCKECFPFYHSREVRALKSKGVTIPERSSVPSGTPKSV